MINKQLLIIAQSLFCHFSSKILERLMYNRLLNYLSLHNILVDSQCGFREAHFTSMALMRMVNDISNELDNNIYSLGVFIDLSKVFDKVDHRILFKKMYHCGIRGIVLEWFNDYIENHTQYVSINNAN